MQNDPPNVAPPTDELADELNQAVTFICERYSMSRPDLGDLLNDMLHRLANASERHHVPFEDLLVKLVWVARHPPEHRQTPDS